jgi:hypothetical protein
MKDVFKLEKKYLKKKELNHFLGVMGQMYLK